VRRHLNASEVAELAELLEDAPVRVGVVDDVLQAAADGRGMTLTLQPRPPPSIHGDARPPRTTDVDRPAQGQR